MTVIELAKQFGDEIAKEEVVVRFKAAKAAYESNEELNNAMYEYNTQRQIVGDEYKKPEGEQNGVLIAMAKERMEELAKAIVAFEEYRAFSEAEQAMNRLMTEINSEITYAVFGERPCTHDCSSCHADCHSRED